MSSKNNVSTPDLIPGLPNFMNDSLLNEVNKLAIKNRYDFILISYSYWADIVNIFNKAERKVLDTHDFLTLQLFYHGKESYREVGNMFADEMGRMSKFDDILHISSDEKSLFSNFIPNKRHHFVPQFFEGRSTATLKEKKFDILFVGSGNPYNVEGLYWFINNVLSLLRKDIKIAIAGSLCEKVNFEEVNITKLGFVSDIDALYQDVHCVICPLRKGSGLKIKVIEAISYGIPVVSTFKGIDGFPNKDPGGGVLVAEEPELFANILNKLIGDSNYYEKQRKMASELFEKYFNLDSNYLNLDAIFN